MEAISRRLDSQANRHSVECDNCNKRWCERESEITSQEMWAFNWSSQLPIFWRGDFRCWKFFDTKEDPFFSPPSRAGGGC